MAETCKALGGYEMMGESAPIARLCMTKSLCVSVREVAESVWCGRVSCVLVGTWYVSVVAPGAGRPPPLSDRARALVCLRTCVLRVSRSHVVAQQVITTNLPALPLTAQVRATAREPKSRQRLSAAHPASV